MIRKDKQNTLEFTLIELLVVIAVIAVLVAVLLPGLASARIQGQQTVCANNLRQLGLAMHMYLDDHDGTFPPTSHGNPDLTSAWVYTLAPYLEDSQLVADPLEPGRTVRQIGRVRICPRDPKAQERFEAGGTSYITNDYVTVPKMGPFGGIIESETFNTRRKLDYPHRVYLVFVGAARWGVQATNDHTHARDNWNTWDDVVWDIAPARFGGDETTGLGGSSNYLFADMSLERAQASDMRALIDAGINFADPERPSRPDASR